MAENNRSARGAIPGQTVVERASGRELVATRSFDGPARILFQAWTTPEMFMRWWAPKSMGATILSCDLDVRTGGRYRLEFGHPASDQTMAFFGRYIEVIADARLVWTNDEGGEGAVTTVTFEEKDGKTLLVMHELYPSEQALDASLAGMEGCTPEQFDQLQELLVVLTAGPP